MLIFIIHCITTFFMAYLCSYSIIKIYLLASLMAHQFFKVIIETLSISIVLTAIGDRRNGPLKVLAGGIKHPKTSNEPGEVALVQDYLAFGVIDGKVPFGVGIRFGGWAGAS